MNQILHYFLHHPLARKNLPLTILKFFFWQISSRFFRYQTIKFGTKSKLLVQKGMTGATGNIYCGLHEFEDMGWLLHTLQANDLFLDIGANVGSYSVLAGSETGAEFWSFEPIPSTFAHLERNIAINSLSGGYSLHNMGLGAKQSTLSFTNDNDTVNHVVETGTLNSIDVPVRPLDSFPFPDKKRLFKIDVEGYEKFVFDGGKQTFADLDSTLGIIVELNGSGNRYGSSDLSIHQSLIQKGYASFTYDPFSRKLKPVNKPLEHNTIYIPETNLELVRGRVATAAKRRIHGVSF